MTPRPLCGLRRPFRLWRNRAGRSHAARVLHRARNSLRSFRGPARKPGPCRACTRHFAFGETGQAGHTLRVCCIAPEIRCAHSGAPLANPALVRLAPPISPLAKPGRPVTRCACVASRPKFAALIPGPRSQTRPLCGLRRPFRLWRNRAGRSHAARVLHRARNSLRSFRGPARKPGPCAACAAHFAKAVR